MSAITTHVLDTVQGKPAVGLAIRLDKKEGNSWISVASNITDIDGRCSNLEQDAVDSTWVKLRLRQRPRLSEST